MNSDAEASITAAGAVADRLDPSMPPPTSTPEQAEGDVGSVSGDSESASASSRPANPMEKKFDKWM